VPQGRVADGVAVEEDRGRLGHPGMVPYRLTKW
jgi:hypothetical protein